ncbi:MAG: ankyrin repeat domain-containing protein [Bacteroidota bacterium]
MRKDKRQYGGDINLPNKEGTTPIIAAVLFEKKNLVPYLLLQGADPNIKDKKGQNAFDFASLISFPLSTIIASVKNKKSK